jgi:hypothetical protein
MSGYIAYLIIIIIIIITIIILHPSFLFAILLHH